jgi:hypothetical protein
MPQASRAEAKDADDRPRNIVLAFSAAALEFETAGLKHIPDGRAGRAHHARTYGRKRRGPPAGLTRVAVILASASLRSRHTRSTY